MLCKLDVSISLFIVIFSGICSDKGKNDPVLRRLQEYFAELASAYINICKRQKREFFGLRDFYR